MNGRGTLSKATQQHGRQSDQITNGTWKVQQRPEGNTTNNLYAVMDEQSRHQRQQLGEEVYREPIGKPTRSISGSPATNLTQLRHDKDWQWEFQRKLEVQSQRHSVRMMSPRGGGQVNGKDDPVTSSAKPIVNSRCQVNSSQANCYHEAKY
ncbi:hypothetical protein B9Z55_010889 [Caenorhabditis nigoni]|uniref:Uncharacterized protein n=1 Tax=Caenorhabditis nigoni TaxID=1611254 RepID=A0A2G5UHN9_9PELO|nr:hypothetical protein B9Z55_010889 [Caenorhabditis nigoni]